MSRSHLGSRDGGGRAASVLGRRGGGSCASVAVSSAARMAALMKACGDVQRNNKLSEGLQGSCRFGSSIGFVKQFDSVSIRFDLEFGSWACHGRHRFDAVRSDVIQCDTIPSDLM